MTVEKSELHPKVASNETSVDNIERFLEEAPQESEGFVPVEYKVELVHDLVENRPGRIHNPCYNIEEALNELGAEGWELVVWNKMDGYAIFKRC